MLLRSNDEGENFAAGRARKSLSPPGRFCNSSKAIDVEEVLSMAVDNDHARSGHPWQGSTPASHVWARQLNSKQIGRKKRRESLLAVQHGRFVNSKPGLSMEEPDL